MTIGIDDLVALQRFEFDQAAKLRNRVIACQFMVALPGAASVLVENGLWLYFLAFAGGILLLTWLILDSRYRAHRTAGERIRKATLLTYGLGERLSASELLALEAALPVVSRPRPVKVEVYFATQAVPGLTRVSEMLEESAFWSADLHRRSAIAMGTIFAFLLGTGIIVAMAIIPFAHSSTLMVVVRILLALLVFALSSDILGAVRGHWRASSDTAEILTRLQKAAASDHPIADVFFLMSEYNSAVEGAPVVLPLVYALRHAKLDDLWKGYQATRARGQ
jgi:hypothetical protein